MNVGREQPGRRGDRRGEPRQCSLGKGARSRCAPNRAHPEPERHQAPAAGSRSRLAGVLNGLRSRSCALPCSRHAPCAVCGHGTRRDCASSSRARQRYAASDPTDRSDRTDEPRPPSIECYRHRLELGVVVQRLLAQLAADAARFEPAERRGRVEDVVAVDPDRAGADALGDGVGLLDVAGPDGGRQAVVGRVGALDDFVDVLELAAPASPGPKISSVAIAIVVLHVGEDGRLDEVALASRTARRR